MQYSHAGRRLRQMRLHGGHDAGRGHGLLQRQARRQPPRVRRRRRARRRARARARAQGRCYLLEVFLYT